MKGRWLSIFVVLALVASIVGRVAGAEGGSSHDCYIYHFGKLDRPGRGYVHYRRGLGRRRGRRR